MRSSRLTALHPCAYCDVRYSSPLLYSLRQLRVGKVKFIHKSPPTALKCGDDTLAPRRHPRDHDQSPKSPRDLELRRGKGTL